MCRLVAYLGNEMLLETILVKPGNSLLKQSMSAKESEQPTNGDGFGLGWYNPDISPEPGLFTSTTPAWNNMNLLHLASKIKSGCFFGHVRAASTGGVTHYNCHPFVYKDWMFMHNGTIHDFIKVKRHIRHLLEDDIYNWIKGETDSEHVFALFMQMARGRDFTDSNNIATLIEDVIKKLEELIQQYGKPGPSFLNLCITDGKRLIASRYCTDKHKKPESLHYATGNSFELEHSRYHMTQKKGNPECIIVSSEMLNDFSNEWQAVPNNHLLLVESNFDVKLIPIP